MKYELLYNNFIKLYPNDKKKLDDMAKALEAEPSDGMHIMFGMVVVPFVADLIEKGDNEKVRAAFAFFEKMAKEKNDLISEVLEFTILEDFISRGDLFLHECKKYMGRETLKSCLYLEQYM